MIIRKYLVNDMNEAMTRIRYELGRDAVIISQRKARIPGIKGFFSKRIVEVTAAAEYNVQEKKQNKNDVVKTEEKNINSSSTDEEVLKEIKKMKELVSNISIGSTQKIGRRSRLQIMLEDSELNKNLTNQILSEVKAGKEDLSEAERTRTAIEKMVCVSKPKMEGVVVLVGPTGVGKTTTIAKLAGRLSLIEKKKVGLITIDTYRIGAVEQLKTYANIIGIPFIVVYSMKEIESAVKSMNDCDVILIDTTGRSSKNAMQISELNSYIKRTSTDNIHLVISCTVKEKDIVSIVEGYKPLNYSNIIITKLDETSSYGTVLNILDAAKKPLSFITTGQNVPDDIKLMSPSEISSLIIDGD